MEPAMTPETPCEPGAAAGQSDAAHGAGNASGGGNAHVAGSASGAGNVSGAGDTAYEAEFFDPATGAPKATDVTDSVHPDTLLAAERLEDLRRLQAEYVNYKKRVDRDRSLAREAGITHVLESMLPVLDDIHLAREHGDLEGGPFAAISEKLETILAKLGIERFGSVGDEFDPNFHEALMNIAADLPEGTTATTVVTVLQPGFRIGERVVRAARVAVANPQ